ncbi:uncharacterized protein LOC111915926 [Lactuca sativa]|uniref:uncharacterized protein LOC111915926 n=1 Tax=Lactuca sativa TaxID=4236 RepID=UPI000CD89444|nr:uncharacterized protein LOC111915926 [Lactuca sativa]
MMKEQHTMMIDQQASLRNHQTSIHNLEVQLGQLTTFVSNKLSSQFPEKNAQSYVMMIDTEEEAIFEFLEAIKEEPNPSRPKSKKSKLENKIVVETPDSRREPSMLTMLARSEQKNSKSILAYRPPLPFPSRAHLSLLEREHLEFIQKIKGIPINTPFIDSLSKIIEYTKFLQDLIDNRQQLKKKSKVILSEQSSRAKTKATNMTIHMANRSVTHSRGIVEDILVKIGKFVFPVDFMIMDIKEDVNVQIILARPLLNTTRALVDVRESKLTLRVGDDEETFGIQDGFQGEDVKGEVFNMDEDNDLEELENLMEEEIKTIHQVKRTKPRASVPFFVEVITHTKPTTLMSEESDELSIDEDEATSKDTSSLVKKEKIPRELNKSEEKLETKGIKRKLDGDETKAKKENSKKAYIRCVQAYKRQWKEYKI